MVFEVREFRIKVSEGKIYQTIFNVDCSSLCP